MSEENAVVSAQLHANRSKDSNCNREFAVAVEPSKQTTSKQCEYTIFNALGATWSAGCFLFDVGTDIWVAYQHYNGGRYWYFGLTLTFIIVPAAIISYFSLRWYSLEQRGKQLSKWRIVSHLLLLGPVVRYYDALKYGLKSTRSKSKQREFYQRSMQEDADATILRLFEGFMEAMPQLFLQMYIMMNSLHEKVNIWTAVSLGASVLASMVSAVSSLAACNKTLWLAAEDESNRPKGEILQLYGCCWLELTSRVTVLGLFASVFPLYMCLVCSLRWLFMSAWIIYIKTPFYENRLEEVLHKLVLGVVFIFCYVDPVGIPTHFRLAAFSVVTFVENGVLLGILWAYGPVLFGYEGIFYIALSWCYLVAMFEMLDRSSVMNPPVGILPVLCRNRISPASQLNIREEIPRSAEAHEADGGNDLDFFTTQNLPSQDISCSRGDSVHNSQS